MKFIDRFKDRHGKVRYYFRRPGGVRIPLHGEPGSPEFLAAHQAAFNGELPEKTDNLPLITKARTFDHLAFEYFASTDFLSLAPSTRYANRKAIERLIQKEKIGHRLVAGMERQNVMAIVARHAQSPGAANDYLKKIRQLIRFSILLGWRKDDPTLLVKTFKTGEWHTWTDEEITKFEAYWPIGTIERTAFSLLLYTGQRLGDVARMTWRDIEAGRIRITQEKTGAGLSIPVHPALARVLDATPKKGMLILINQLGRPFSVKGFGNWMASKIATAGLPSECVTHGIRKAMARRIAEKGGTEKQIASVTGHKTLKEVARYTRAASQAQLSDAAIGLLNGQDGNTESQT
jgi:integrase